MGQVAHALLTRPPLSRDPSSRRIPGRASLDLHVLGTPPAFILSQDQTLVFKSLFRSRIAVRFSFPFLPFLPLRRVAGVPRTSLSENPPFPKILFKKFSRIVVVYCSVVKVLSSFVLLPSLATACLYYHITPTFVNNFFQVFLTLFSVVSRLGFCLVSIPPRIVLSKTCQSCERQVVSYHAYCKLSTIFLLFIFFIQFRIFHLFSDSSFVLILAALADGNTPCPR